MNSHRQLIESDTMESDDLDASLAMHDELLARRGVTVWIGAEPTFTRAASVRPGRAAADRACTVAPDARRRASRAAATETGRCA